MATIEDIKALESYEYYFNSAINNNYCRNFSSKQYQYLNDIYERMTGHRYTVNWGCPHCTIRFVQEVGRTYFRAKEELAKVQEQPEPETVTPSAPKKKGGRPKKQATNKETKTE